MELKNDFRVAVPVERAWAVLTDVELIAPCLPGAQLQEIEGDEYRGIVKVNPLATWTDEDVEGYVRDHGLPVHPLRDRGYPSIGCWPCTRPVAEGDDPRSGRWGGRKGECGIHA